MIRVLLGDDHRIVREGLKQVLADAPDMQVLAEAQSGPEVLARVLALMWLHPRAEALAAALGSSSGKTGAETLSLREHQVFRLLTTGHSVSEIGAPLNLAANTVSTYRARILEKTGTRNDVELALFAERQGKPVNL